MEKSTSVSLPATATRSCVFCRGLHVGFHALYCGNNWESCAAKLSTIKADRWRFTCRKEASPPISSHRTLLPTNPRPPPLLDEPQSRKGKRYEKLCAKTGIGLGGVRGAVTALELKGPQRWKSSSNRCLQTSEKTAALTLRGYSTLEKKGSIK